jgi:hypothetical protein
MNNFYKNAAIVSVVSSLPAIFFVGSEIAGWVGCLLLIGLTIFMYKQYADSEQIKTKLTLGQGAKFGAIIGVISLIIAIVVHFATNGAALELALEKAVNTPDFDQSGMSEEDMLGIIKMTVYVMWALTPALTALIGLIAGAIFKHDTDPDADLLNEIKN